MSSDVTFKHAETQARLMAWLTQYWIGTRGTRVLDRGRMLVNRTREIQPDAILFIDPRSGGKVWVDAPVPTGLPDLVVELSDTTLAHDLDVKRLEYESLSIPEYLLINLVEERVHWFVLEGGCYRNLEADPDGIFRSRVFPGLWLDPEKVVRGSVISFIETLQQGLASPEHAAFCTRLRGR